MLPVVDDGTQPVNYEQIIGEVYSEIIHRMNARVVYDDCTSSDSVLPHICLQEGVPYPHICLGVPYVGSFATPRRTRSSWRSERLQFLVFIQRLRG